MKGTIFNVLQEFVEQHHGYELWDDVIIQCDLPSKGIFTSTKYYEDSELFTLVGALSSQLNVPANELVSLFGEYLFPKLMPQAPVEAQKAPSLRAFLMMVDSVIHVEVQKLYKESNLPDFNYDDSEDTTLEMHYQSPRKLCYLSEGLIKGAAKHFNQAIEITQTQCMHQGSEHCNIKVTFK